MSVIHKQGDIFTTSQPAIGHGVNTHGVMGAGIAKTVRKLHPDVYEIYKDRCRKGMLKVGDVLPVFSISEPNRWIFNIASQDAPGPTADYKWVELGIGKSLIFASKMGISGIALPRIGAGIGGLDWELVEPLITTAAAQHPQLDVEIWEYVP